MSCGAPVAGPSFVRWVVAAFEGRTEPNLGPKLDPKRNDVLSSEDVGILREIIPRGVLRHLVLDGTGWRRAPEPLGSEVRWSRIWEADFWKDHPMVFGPGAIELLLGAFSSLRERYRDGFWQPVLPVSAAESWLHHALACHVLATRIGPFRPDPPWLRVNPLEVFALLDPLGMTSEELGPKLESIFQLGADRVLPWLGRSIVGQWLERDDERWMAPEVLAERNGAESMILGFWLSLVERRDRWDLAVPVLSFYLGLQQSWPNVESLERRLDRIFAGRSLRSRTDAWVGYFQPVFELERLVAEARRLQPYAEREGHHRILIEAAADDRLGGVVRWASELRSRLEGVLG